jgi:hypothetical protein
LGSLAIHTQQTREIELYYQKPTDKEDRTPLPTTIRITPTNQSPTPSPPTPNPHTSLHLIEEVEARLPDDKSKFKEVLSPYLSLLPLS